MPDNEVQHDNNVLERIDKIMDHILEMKDEMYKRSDWKSDSALVYAHIDAIQTQVLLSMREALSGIDRRTDFLERDAAKKAVVDSILTQLAQQVPRTEHITHWDNDNKRFQLIEQRLGIVEKRALPAYVVAGVGTLLGGVISYIVQAALHGAAH